MCKIDDTLDDNLQLLKAFWNRRPFHDMPIESMRRLHGRVLIELTDYALVLLNVAQYREEIEEFPTLWLYEKVTLQAGKALLALDAEMGTATVQFRNLRLIDRRDLTILIPDLDSH